MVKLPPKASLILRIPTLLCFLLVLLAFTRAAECAGAPDGGVATPVRGPYLQNAGPTRVTVRWRTAAPSDSRVRYGSSAADLTTSVDDATETTEHEVSLTGLTPHTTYFYSIGSATSTLAGGSDFTFRTPPVAGTVQPTRVWIIGDSGTANINAAAVRDAYLEFNGTQHTDVWLMLGDNAYGSGFDSEYQTAVFDMYPTLLRSTLLWSTIGNHETYSMGPVAMPYLDIFTLPTAGEGGGLASGTERYFSHDYANIHFVCLDSMTSDRSANGAMAQWLRSDLEETEQKWIVAYWHHPAYTRGSHNSDVESELVEMRENLVPILEAGGVDLVFAGHSHSYERSMLVNGHYGASTTLTSNMVLNAESGRADGTGAYRKPIGMASNQGAVYTVAGTSGQISPWTGGSFAEVNPQPHPIMYTSLLALGSVVLDVDGNRLDAKFIRSNGGVADSFTIIKDIPNQPPRITIAIPADGGVFAAEGDIAIAAAAFDPDGSVQHVEFYANDTLLGTDTSAPFELTWSEVPVGDYAITAVAVDSLGAHTVSSVVHISVMVPPGPPAPPVSLSAKAGSSVIELAWTASQGATRYTILRSTSDGGPYTVVGTVGKMTTYSDTSLSVAGVYYYVARAGNLGGDSGNSPQARAGGFVHVLAISSHASVAGEAATTTFERFGAPSINNSGTLAFMASLSTADGRDTAILAGKPPIIVARKGGSAPGVEGGTFANFYDPLLNNAGRVAFVARVVGRNVTKAEDEGLWSDRAGSLALVALEGKRAPGVNGGLWGRFVSVVLGDQLLAFTANLVLGAGGVTATDDSGLWIADGNTISLALREGQSLTINGAPRTVKSFLALRNGLNSMGHGYLSGFDKVVARVTFLDGGQSVLAFDSTGHTMLAASGDAAAGYGAGAKLKTFGLPAFLSGGAAFRSGLGGVTSANQSAIYTRNATGLVRAFATGASAAAAHPGAVFTALRDPVAADGGRVAVIGTMGGGDVMLENDSGVWWRTDVGEPSLVARKGTGAPGTGSASQPGLFKTFVSVAHTEGPAGAPLFVAKLRQGVGLVNATNDTGLWAVDSTRTLQLLLNNGQPLAGRTVKTFRVLGSVARSPAQTRSFNASRQIASQVFFTDRSEAIIVTSLP